MDKKYKGMKILLYVYLQFIDKNNKFAKFLWNINADVILLKNCIMKILV